MTTTATNLKCHHIAGLLPKLARDEFEALVSDIEAHGQNDAIVLYEGMILDGRHRYWACQKLGIEPKLRDLDPDVDPAAFVVSANIHRRHMSREQRHEVMQKLRDAGQTLRAIAGAVGVSRENVRQHTKPTCKNLKVEGADGKVRPAKYQKRKPEPEPERVNDDDDFAPIPEPEPVKADDSNRVGMNEVEVRPEEKWTDRMREAAWQTLSACKQSVQEGNRSSREVRQWVWNRLSELQDELKPWRR